VVEETSVNDLKKYFIENTSTINKLEHYFDIYDRHFKRYKRTDVCIVEIGVAHGGSLQMWKDYFGADAKIYGVDIDPNCKRLEEKQIKIIIGNQADRQFLKSVADTIPRIDILIDDGGHKFDQQINTFEELFPHIDKEGIYLCEDLHTSYLSRFGGGYQKKGSFIEYSKNFIDFINAWHSEQLQELDISDFTRSAYSLHYYNNILVIEKRPIKHKRIKYKMKRKKKKGQI